MSSSTADSTAGFTDLPGLLQLGAARIARAVADGQASALELCDAAIAAIEVRDATLNAVVVRDFERARAQARAADARRARGEQAPLLGVPMTVKESFNVAGLPTSWGLPPFRDYRPREDAVAVQRLKAAGAVLLGKTNVAAALADWQSDNPVYGRTVHPLDATRTPGGSSGGSAAAVAAGLVPLELGSDLMGSIRVPAAFCGIYGHKPSLGLVPMRGHNFPGTEGPPSELLAVGGPLARSAADLGLALDVLAGADAPEAIAWRLALPAPRHGGEVRRHRVLLLTGHPVAPVAAELHEALEAAAGRLAQAGASVARSSPLLPDLAQVHGTYQDIVLTLLAALDPASGRSALDAHGWIGLMMRRGQLRAQWRALFEAFDAVLCPAFGCAAFEHQREPDWQARTLTIDGQPTPYAAQSAWASLASLAGLPATVAPLGHNAAGLPLAAQIIGPYLEDRTPIALAGWLGEG